MDNADSESRNKWFNQCCELQNALGQLQAENKGLTKQLMEHGEALNVLSTLRQLYNLSPDMREPRVESAAKMMMRQSEEGLRLAHARTREEYIKELQAEIKNLRKQAIDLMLALEDVVEHWDDKNWPDDMGWSKSDIQRIINIFEQALKGESDGL